MTTRLDEIRARLRKLPDLYAVEGQTKAEAVWPHARRLTVAWTVSPDPERPGWCTDSGRLEYGLPWSIADALARVPADAVALLRVAEEVRALRDSGYDGPMMGEAVEPLFRALAELERT